MTEARRREPLFLSGGRIFVLLAVLCLFGAGAAAETFAGDVTAQLFQKGGMPTASPPAKARAVLPEEEIRRVIFDGLDQCAEEIDLAVYKLTYADFRRLYADVLNGHPELFYVSGEFSYFSTGLYVTTLFPSYDDSGDALARKRYEYRASVARIAAYAAAGDTPLLKCALVNDYFCAHFSYDRTGSVFDSYSLFTGGTGVCQAYMEGYAAVLNALGIPVSFAASDAMNHTWNLVRLDGHWYHADVTWNDLGSTGSAGHGYFLLSDDRLRNNPGFSAHYGWESGGGIVCDSTRFDDEVWRAVQIPLIVRGDAFFAVSNQGADCMLVMWRNQAVRELFAFSAYADGESAIYGYDFGSIALTDGCLVFTTADTLMVYRPETDEMGFCFRCPDGLGIRESAFEDGRWVYALGGDSSAVSERGSLDLSALTRFLARGDALIGVYGAETRIDIPEYLGVGIIGSDAFRNLPSVVCVTLPDTIRTISENAFRGCAALETVTLPRSILSIAPDAFRDCARLTAVCYENSLADAYCAENGIARSLLYGKALLLPAGLLRIEDEAFMNSDAEEITVPDGVRSIGARTFANCENLKIVRLPGSATYIASDAFLRGEQAVFYVPEGSYAMEFAKSRGYAFAVVGE